MGRLSRRERKRLVGMLSEQVVFFKRITEDSFLWKSDNITGSTWVKSGQKRDSRIRNSRTNYSFKVLLVAEGKKYAP